MESTYMARDSRRSDEEIYIDLRMDTFVGMRGG